MDTTITPASDPYALLAEAYDYATWGERLIELVAGHRPVPRSVLDVACGTGLSAQPFLGHGCRVVGVDSSSAMLDAAQLRLGDQVELVHADMRELPALGRFELIVCLDDSLNHLSVAPEVIAALRGMAANLASDGLVLFDLNTLSTLRAAFSSDWIARDEDRVLLWQGAGSPELAAGASTSAHLELFTRQADRWRSRSTDLIERHYPVNDVADLLMCAGLEPITICPQLRGARLLPGQDIDENTHHKAVVLARRSRGPADWARAHQHEGGPW